MFAVLGAMLWLIGGNVICMSHHRRMGRSIWSDFRWKRPPTFSEFNMTEWVLMILLAVVCLALARHGLGTQI